MEETYHFRDISNTHFTLIYLKINLKFNNSTIISRRLKNGYISLNVHRCKHNEAATTAFFRTLRSTMSMVLVQRIQFAFWDVYRDRTLFVMFSIHLHILLDVVTDKRYLADDFADVEKADDLGSDQQLDCSLFRRVGQETTSRD